MKEVIAELIKSEKYKCKHRFILTTKLTNMKSILLFIPVILLLFSCCANNEDKLKKQLIGEWVFFEKRPSHINTAYPPPPSPFPDNGFTFYEDGKCECKLDYFRIIRDEEGNRHGISLGNITKYKIWNDSIGIYNLSDSTWLKRKILLLHKDSIGLQTEDSTYNVYIRPKYIINPEEKYDKIIVSSSGCYGSCPVMNICINQDGFMIYEGLKHNTPNGLFTSTLTTKEFQQIETRFKKASISALREEYLAGWTDDEEVSITFVKNNKIFKSVRDYGHQSPKELIWAYMPVRYLYQHIKLQPYKSKVPDLYDLSIEFETKLQICSLLQSESFYLKTELYKSKEVSLPFDAKYTITYWTDDNYTETIYTDGRYFKIHEKNQWRTLDLGYNFLAKNNLMGRFRKKTEDD
jgi:hypothetical protein